jgi:uncharacterized UBP type Zn finger protein
MGFGTRLKNTLLRRLWTGRFGARTCTHLDQIREVEPQADVCLACQATGDSYPAMRMCLTCGHVGCCDDAKNQHALHHFRATGHPLIRPHREPGMDWIWCYADEALLEPSAAPN